MENSRELSHILRDIVGYPDLINSFTDIRKHPKRKRNAHAECWVVTTDLTLIAEEVREAAHLRRQIENNVFKRLSHLSGIKRFTFKEQKPFLTMLLLFFAAITIFDIYTYMLQQNEEAFKHVLGGITFTWVNFFSQLEEQMEDRFFCIIFSS